MACLIAFICGCWVGVFIGILVICFFMSIKKGIKFPLYRGEKE